MTEYSGKTVCGGIAIGKLHIIAKTVPSIERYEVADSSKEIQRLEAAKEEAKAQLADLYEKAAAEVGEAQAAIFEVHQMLIDDSRYLGAIQNYITEQRVNVEYAVSITADKLGEKFTKTGDAYMRERAADVKDISDRIIRILVREDGKILSDKISAKSACSDNRNYEHADSGSIITDAPVIILADDLSPSETVQLDKNLVLSFVTVHGSVNSHAAILARTMNKPALIGVGIEITSELEGKTAIVDAITGKLYIEPDEEMLNEMLKRREEDMEKQKHIQVLKGKESVTRDGRRISLCANIGSVGDLEQVLQNDAEGIGLFRSELIYLENSAYPTEEEQFRIYRQVAEVMAGKRVIVRTLDIGADKQADYFQLDMVCKNAHAENTRVGICGELGADLELTERFLKMGVDELSVSPSYVLPLRDRVRSIDLSR